MYNKVEEWLFHPPTHLTEDEALERAADIVREIETTDKNAWLVMLMLFWAHRTHDHEFKALFYDFRKAPSLP